MKSKLTLSRIIHADTEMCAATVGLCGLTMAAFCPALGEGGAETDSQFGMSEELKDLLGKPSLGLLVAALSDAGDC